VAVWQKFDGGSGSVAVAMWQCGSVAVEYSVFLNKKKQAHLRICRPNSLIHIARLIILHRFYIDSFRLTQKNV
jgi:hypothetical protein